jgi:hypothetical protein
MTSYSGKLDPPDTDVILRYFQKMSHVTAHLCQVTAHLCQVTVHL